MLKGGGGGGVNIDVEGETIETIVGFVSYKNNDPLFVKAPGSFYSPHLIWVNNLVNPPAAK